MIELVEVRHYDATDDVCPVCLDPVDFCRCPAPCDLCRCAAEDAPDNLWPIVLSLLALMLAVTNLITYFRGQ